MNSSLAPLDIALQNTSYAAGGFQPSTSEDQAKAAEAAASIAKLGAGGLAFSAAWMIATTAGFGLAAAKSYGRNESIPWAFGSGLIWPAYLMYVYVVAKD